jgi:hypothetical protein
MTIQCRKARRKRKQEGKKEEIKPTNTHFKSHIRAGVIAGYSRAVITFT